MTSVTTMSCNTPAAVHHSHQRPQLLFLDRYALHKTIGEGTYGKVKLATNTHTSQQVALKIIEKKSLRRTVDVQRLKNEVRIMHLVRHPNIVHLFEVLESDTQIVFESEYAAGGELYNLIVQTGPLTHAFAHSVFVQLVAAVEYLHAHFIVHRDIKPENIMVSRRGEAKIVDFGFARFYNRSADCSTSCGSLKYCAPEVIRHEKYQGPEVDVWSLGVTLYTMINASLPFMSETNNEAEIVRRICSSHPRAGLHFDRDSLDLVLMMLRKDRATRATISQVASHVWTTGTPSVSPASSATPATPTHTRTLTTAATNAWQTRHITTCITHPETAILDQFDLFGFDVTAATLADLASSVPTPVHAVYTLLSRRRDHGEVVFASTDAPAPSPSQAPSPSSAPSPAASPAPETDSRQSLRLDTNLVGKSSTSVLDSGYESMPMSPATAILF